jgi:hypothetical protein
MQESINKNKHNIEASIGYSRKWNSKEAGREVAKNVIKKLNTPPSFILLFSTTHYKNSGGFRDLLKGFCDVIPKGTPLIGGTVSSFINNYGCFSRGVTALAVSYPNIDIAIGVGKYTKIRPKNAAKSCAAVIKKGLRKSKYKNKLIIDVISGPTIPNIPGIGRFMKIESKTLGNLISYFFVDFFCLLGHGIGKEGDVLYELSNYFPDFQIIGNSAGERLFNYQFVNDKVYTNSIVALGCSFDIPVNINSAIVSHETDKSFKITGTTYNNRIITKIDNKPARDTFFNLLEIDNHQFGNFDDFYYKTSVYFPMTFEEKKENTLGVCGLFGDNIVLHEKAAGKKARLLSVTGQEIINNFNKIIMTSNQSSPFTLIFFSSLYSYILHDRTHDLKDKLEHFYGDKPFLAIGSLVENVKIKNQDPSVHVYSINMFQLGINDFINIMKNDDK